MKFLTLDIENFLAITKATINLADRGLVLIQGINHSDTSAASNGAGKSTIADALCWAIYGTTAREVSGDDVINDAAGKNTRVEVRIQDGPMTYRIVRHRKHKPNKNAVQLFQSNGLTEVDLTKGKEALTQAEILKVIGASHEVFVGAVYAGQEKMPDLPGMTDKHLKMLIEEAAGVTVLEEAYRIAREDLNAVKLKLDAANADLDGLNRKGMWTQNQITDTKASLTDWDSTNTFRQQRVTDGIVELVGQIKAIDVSFDLAAAELELKALDEKIAAVAGENAEFTRLDRVANQKTSDLALIDIAIRQLEAGIIRLDGELANIEHKVGCPCDDCGRPLTEAELGDAKMAVARKITEATTELEQKKVDRKAAFVASTEAADARDAFLLSMTDLSATTSQRASLQRAIDVHNYNVGERDKLLARARDQKAMLERMKLETNPHQATLDKLTKDLAEIDRQIAAQVKVCKGLEAEVELETENVKTFGPTGARATILDEVTPFLNIQTAKYLSTLSDGNIEATWSTLTPNSKGELKEKFSIDVTNSKGGKLFKAISGGEKKKVRVATALALQDLVATRAVKPIELFIGDEIDGALDPAGLERLTMVLDEKAAERGTVLVISHLEMRDWIPNVMQVEKSATGETTITEFSA